MFEKEFIKTLAEKIEKAALEKNTDYFCTMRDIFQARLDSYVARTSNYLASAIIGEIGNNTFDHNCTHHRIHGASVRPSSRTAGKRAEICMRSGKRKRLVALLSIWSSLLYNKRWWRTL